jgi:hypothetical protein
MKHEIEPIFGGDDVVVDQKLNRRFRLVRRLEESHHQIARLDGDPAERCGGNLPFASRLMALLQSPAIGRDRLLSKAKSHFPA